jgi:hypothetical protein
MVAGTVGDRGTATGRPGPLARADSRGRYGSRGPAARAARGGRERIDVTQAMTVQTLVAEAGLDMSQWPREYHLVSWIGLAPRNEVSGGKLLKNRTRKVVSRLATALRMAATALRTSKSYLGAQFRRLQSRQTKQTRSAQDDHRDGRQAGETISHAEVWRGVR